MIEFAPDPDGRANHFVVEGYGLIALAAGSYTLGDDVSIEAALQAVVTEIDNPTAPTLAELKIEKAMAAQAEQESRMGLGVRVTVGQNDYILSSDPGQRELILIYATSLAAGLTFPIAGIRLITRAGEELTANLVQFQLAFTAWRTRVKALRDHYADIVAAIRGASDETELAAIDISGGWPAV